MATATATAAAKKKGPKGPRQPIQGPYGRVYQDKETASESANVVYRPGENNTFRLFLVRRYKDNVAASPKFVWASNWHEAFALVIVGEKGRRHSEKNPDGDWEVGPADGKQRGQVKKLTVSDVRILKDLVPAVRAGKVPAVKLDSILAKMPHWAAYVRSEAPLELPADLLAESETFAF